MRKTTIGQEHINPRLVGTASSASGKSFGFDANVGFGGVETVDSGGAADVLEAAWLHEAFINLDPGGGSITLTTDTAANMVADGAPLETQTVRRVILRNAADAAETITIAGGAGVTVRRAEGSADLVIGQNEAAELTFVKVSGSAVELYVTPYV